MPEPPPDGASIHSSARQGHNTDCDAEQVSEPLSD